VASDNWKLDIEKRSSDNRRAARDRRSGVDIRSEEEKRIIGERRANADRRSGKDRRAPSSATIGEPDIPPIMASAVSDTRCT
jgi:hypothetical protein